MNTTTRFPYIAALRLRIATWWAGLGPLAWTACVAALCVVAALLLVVMFRPAPEQAPPPAAVQTNPLAPLVARLDALEADVVNLQDRAADLEDAQPPQPTAPRRRAAASTPANPSQAAQPQQPQAPQPEAWGATDLDRAIDEFTPPTTFGAKP